MGEEEEENHMLLWWPGMENTVIPGLGVMAPVTSKAKQSKSPSTVSVCSKQP